MALHELITRYARQSGEIASPAEAKLSPARAADAAIRGRVAGLSLGWKREAPVAVFVIDPDRVSGPTAQQLQLQFGLTPAEAQLACESPRAKA